MKRFIVFLAGVCVLSACSHYAKDSSAAKRAERLNAAKAQARSFVQDGRFEDAIGILEPLSEEASGDNQVFVMLG